MKTKHNIFNKISLSALLLLAVGVAGCASSGPRVTEERKFIQLHHVANTGKALNLKKGDAIAMACTKCKTVLFANVERPRTRFFVPLEHRHYCPGCNSIITTTGAGFNLKEDVKHTCDACGSDSVFCCATKRESPPTANMEKKFEVIP
jgi:RNase P subunit RPR2